MKLKHVIGAPPNFIKAAPVWSAINKKTNFDQILVHTGQHYDKLSDLISNTISENKRSNTIIPLWDGKALDRIAEILSNKY